MARAGEIEKPTRNRARRAAETSPAESPAAAEATSSGSSPTNRTLAQRFRLGLGILGGWALFWILNLTLRRRFEGWENYQAFRDLKKPVILSFWHNQILLATYVFRFRDIVVITSRHRDGDYIAGVIRLFGYAAARGSSTRGAVGALLQLKKELASGVDVAFTIDGPRGPVYRVKPGPVLLSQKSGRAIVPFHIEPEKFWRLRSWDRFRIPKPFTRVLVKIGRPLNVPPHADREPWVRKYQEEMDRIRRYCREYSWD